MAVTTIIYVPAERRKEYASRRFGIGMLQQYLLELSVIVKGIVAQMLKGALNVHAFRRGSPLLLRRARTKAAVCNSLHKPNQRPPYGR